jgi:amino acid permease
VLFGVIFGYYFLLIGKICGITWTATFREAWKETMGDKGAVWVALCIALKPALGNLANSMILADTVRALFETINLSVSRTTSLLLVTIVVLLPLCMLKNLKVLAPFSIIGTMVFILVSIVMGVRYFDGTYGLDGVFVEVSKKISLTFVSNAFVSRGQNSLFAGSSGPLKAILWHHRHSWCIHAKCVGLGVHVV